MPGTYSPDYWGSACAFSINAGEALTNSTISVNHRRFCRSPRLLRSLGKNVINIALVTGLAWLAEIHPAGEDAVQLIPGWALRGMMRDGRDGNV